MDVATLLTDTTRHTLQLAVAGDQEAFADIVEAHHRDLTHVCFVICGDPDLADEAAQAAWTRAWRRLGSLRDPDRLRPWLVSIAANAARDLVRGRRRNQVVELHLVADRPGGIDPAVRPMDIDLRAALLRLDADDRALLALRYVAGIDSFELAHAIGLSPSGTRARLARALARLKAELADG